MSAIVCGKRSFFEELPSPSVSKRIRRSPSSPIRLSPTRTAAGSSSSYLSAIDHLSSLFPEMDKQLLERALKECDDDLDLAIRSLNDLRLGSAESMDPAGGKPEATSEIKVQLQASGDQVPASKDPVTINGADWVELFVVEMKNASNMDDARNRASRALEVFEKSVISRSTAQAAQTFQQENSILKEQLEGLIYENGILKRAVSIQHERQKEYEDRSREMHHLKQMLSQYQEQLRTLEVNNYALTMHLKQAQQNSSISGHFNPDVF
ncbi:uncharacterized protein LOC124926059 [Impatiens glandulifera]|uniref:uncharacterized protein LOC124926059 n=1 Tax=Impatiens glandulifera TaxID=253017 RepID=UPI001FB0CF34|nr:uncharacterized protein LOC124926059 [Impatiens glandulifera]